MEKVNFNKGVKLIVSPTDNGYACGIINEKENLDKGDESLYLCHVVAQGMIKFAIENPQDVFDLGFQQMAESKDNISNIIKENPKRVLQATWNSNTEKSILTSLQLNLKSANYISELKKDLQNMIILLI